MSVPKQKRKQSGIQFLDTAYDLEVHTLRCCMKLPKRMTFFLSTELAHLAAQVHNNCKAANSVFPTNAHEAQLRRDYLTRANASLQALIGKVSLLQEFGGGLSDGALNKWADLMYQEAKLISGAKRADQRRFSF